MIESTKLNPCPSCIADNSISNNVGAITDAKQSNICNGTTVVPVTSETTGTTTFTAPEKTKISIYTIENVTIVNKDNFKNDIKDSISVNLNIPVEDIAIIDLNDLEYFKYILDVYINLNNETNKINLEENLDKLDPKFVFNNELSSKYGLNLDNFTFEQIYTHPPPKSNNLIVIIVAVLVIMLIQLLLLLLDGLII